MSAADTGKEIFTVFTDPFSPFHAALFVGAGAAVFAGKAWGPWVGIVVGVVAGKLADEFVRPRGAVSIEAGEIVREEVT